MHAFGAVQQGGNFRLEWSAPVVGMSGMQGFIVERYVDGVVDETIAIGAGVHSFIDDVAPTGTVFYIVYWFNSEGVSPGSNPVVRGDYPPCNWLSPDEEFPYVELRPLCLIPEV